MTTDPPWFPIRTDRLLLREFRQADLEDIHAYAQDAEVARFMDWGPNTLEESQRHLADKLAEQAVWPRPAVTLAVEHLADRRVIGSIRLEVGDPASRTADMGYSFHRAYWRQGYATEAGRAVLRVGFAVLGLHRIWAECDVDNVGSYGVMEKLGMRRQGHLRASKLVKDRWRDRYLYAVLADAVI